MEIIHKRGLDLMKFDKYIAAGNDFIIFNGIDKSKIDYNELALNVCNRHFGIGADGIMVCENSLVADIKMLYYNSDGSQGEMCGNGIRCFSKYIYDYGIVEKLDISIESLDGIKNLNLEINELNKVKEIRVNMGYPSFDPDDIPVKSKKERLLEEKIIVDGEEYIYSAVLVGVPHVVIFVEDINMININDIGKKVENDPIFPRKINVNFVEILDKENINIYTWERGAGRTLGCGTGSCASVVIGKTLGKLDDQVYVNTEGGKLRVELDMDFKINMIGNASHICKGEMLNL